MRTLGQGSTPRSRVPVQAGRLGDGSERVRGRGAAKWPSRRPTEVLEGTGRADGAAGQARGHVATGASSGSSRARRALHIAVGILGWAVFAGLWIWQLEVFVPANWLAGVQAIGVMMILFVVATPAWVAWNRNIYRRRHRRTTPLVLPVDFERDALGRAIETDSEVRDGAGEIVVEVGDDDRVKRYRSVVAAP